MNWSTTDAMGILIAYVRERRRRATCGSTSGFDEDGRLPGSRGSEDWIDLLLLTQDVPQQALDALELRHCGYRIDEKASKAAKSPIAETEWQTHTELPTGYTVEEYAAAVAMDEYRAPMIQVFAGEFPILLGNREIGRAIGITATEVKQLTQEAVDAVQERLARMKT